MVNTAVIGLGQLGCRIAVELASFGHKVYAYDKDHRQQETLLQRVYDYNLQLEHDGLIDNGRKLHDHITICFSLKEAAEEADFIFEAASEKINIKRAILKEMTAVCPSRTIIGTNTLSLRLESIVDDALFSERILGIRFIYPVFGIPILEYSVSASTSQETIRKSREFFESMGKRLVVKENHAQPLMLNVSQVEQYQIECKERRSQASRSHHGAEVVRTEMPTSNPRSHGDVCVEDNGRREESPCRRIDSEDRTDECVICNENEINAILFPCRHMWLCFPCAEKLKSHSDPCPACRTDIKEIVSVFRP